ncbi:MAG: flavodoxin family protein [Kiritimatiellae bacterium]|jgi:multimeric flavodoxin WrbA|nr:flavodoxin family protein [Kiritimatiellia bacterium]MBR1586852.1 flavodoxin family protein [Kiritimatiellia bacterium]
MKVLMLNGSFNPDGSTSAGLEIMAKTFAEEGVETEIVTVGAKPIADCIACGKCAELKRCVFANDAVNDFAEKAKTSDGFVFGSPVYYAHPSGRIQSFLDRLFFSTMNADRYASLRHKPCASIVVARRAGTSASFDVLNKYATISQMIVVGSTYWNEFHALTKEDVPEDPEGLQTLQNLARNMVYVMKCLKAGRDAGIMPPATKEEVFTNFVRRCE